MTEYEQKVAAVCGVNAALIFSHIKYWTDKNRKNGKNMHGAEKKKENSPAFQTESRAVAASA